MNKLLPVAAMFLSVVALTVTILSGGGERASERAAAPQAPEQTARLEESSDGERIISLEMEVSRLTRRVDALERSGIVKPGEPAAAMTTEQQAKQLQALRSDVDALLTGEPMQTEEGRKRLKEVVRAVQDEVFADRVQERTAQREQQRQDRLKKLVEDARLSPTQAQDLSKLLDDETKQRKVLMEARRSGAGPQNGQGSVREQLQAVRRKTDEGAKGLLSAEQYTQYEAMRAEDRGGGRDRGPGRRD